jgi:hypothetical protein
LIGLTPKDFQVNLSQELRIVFQYIGAATNPFGMVAAAIQGDVDCVGLAFSFACPDLSPPLFALLNHSTHIESWTYLEYRPILQRRMLRDELNGMIHVPRLQHKNAADLFLGFRIGTVGGRNFAVLPIQGQRGFNRLESFSAGPVPVGPQMVVVLKHSSNMAFRSASVMAACCAGW